MVEAQTVDSNNQKNVHPPVVVPVKKKKQVTLMQDLEFEIILKEFMIVLVLITIQGKCLHCAKIYQFE